MIIVLTAFTLLHAFHLSVTEIEITEEGRFEVVMTLFADDLEKAVNLNSEEETLDIFNKKSYAAQRQLIKDYIALHTSLQVDDQPIPLTYVGHELIENRCIVYLEGECNEKAGLLTFKNYALMNAFADQQNVVHLKNGQEKETHLFQTEYDELKYLLN